MKRRDIFRLMVVTLGLIFMMTAGCGKGEAPKVAEAPKPETQQALPLTTNPVAGLAAATPAGTTPAAKPANPSDVIIEVDGTKLTTGRFDSDLKKQMAAARDQIPANQVDQARASIKKRIVQEFIVRTLLADEIKRKNITTSEKEVAEALESIKKNLPPGMTIDEMMKKNQVTGKEMAQNLAFSINVHKLVVASMGNKKKPTDKEIADFYKKNKDKFKTPDTARARHILIAKAAGDDEKAKAEKRAKAEGLRKQLLGGANFADLAAKNSDCPSKQNGGDLGVFARGQMVKPFEDAAFSQKINEIGPVVETEFGYHIIQVTERSVSKAMPLDKDIKAKISAFLEGRKHQEAYGVLIKNLREKANVVVYREP